MPASANRKVSNLVEKINFNPPAWNSLLNQYESDCCITETSKLGLTLSKWTNRVPTFQNVDAAFWSKSCVGACGTDRKSWRRRIRRRARRVWFSRSRHEISGARSEQAKCQRITKKAIWISNRPPSGKVLRPNRRKVILIRPTTSISERGIAAARLYGQFYASADFFLVKIPPAIQEVAVLSNRFRLSKSGLKQVHYLWTLVENLATETAAFNGKRRAFNGDGFVGAPWSSHGFGRDKREALFECRFCASGNRRDLWSDNGDNRCWSDEKYGEYDLIFECIGLFADCFDAMQSLNENGILISSSVTGGDRKTDSSVR